MYVTLLNQIYEIESKMKDLKEGHKIIRNVDRMKEVFQEYQESGDTTFGLFYEDPMGQFYDESRSDLDAHIAGEDLENLVVIDVVKPIIRYKEKAQGHEISKVVQNGIVTVSSKLKEGECDE